tara:strand:- start:1640 stop:2275 length:636 start_codon:yes stop_codon:yes gene_type:complete
MDCLLKFLPLEMLEVIAKHLHVSYMKDLKIEIYRHNHKKNFECVLQDIRKIFHTDHRGSIQEFYKCFVRYADNKTRYAFIKKYATEECDYICDTTENVNRKETLRKCIEKLIGEDAENYDEDAENYDDEWDINFKIKNMEDSEETTWEVCNRENLFDEFYSHGIVGKYSGSSPVAYFIGESFICNTPYHRNFNHYDEAYDRNDPIWRRNGY